jgi:hypothetical protein
LSNKKKPEIEQLGRLNIRNIALTDRVRKKAFRIYKSIERLGRGKTIGTGAILTYLRFSMYYDHLNFMIADRSGKPSRIIYNPKLQKN